MRSGMLPNTGKEAYSISFANLDVSKIINGTEINPQKSVHSSQTKQDSTNNLVNYEMTISSKEKYSSPVIVRSGFPEAQYESVGMSYLML
jgi:hypothetical protein